MESGLAATIQSSFVAKFNLVCSAATVAISSVWIIMLRELDIQANAIDISSKQSGFFSVPTAKLVHKFATKNSQKILLC